MENKISAYIGFAKKSNKVIYGMDNLKVYDKKLYLIIVCMRGNNKYIDFALSKKKETGCDVLRTNGVLLDELAATNNCKILGIKSKELSTAIIKNKAENLVEVI